MASIAITAAYQASVRGEGNEASVHAGALTIDEAAASIIAVVEHP